MSYILDALRKAAQERGQTDPTSPERALTGPAEASSLPGAAGRSGPWVWAPAALAGFALGVAGLWIWMRPDAAPAPGSAPLRPATELAEPGASAEPAATPPPTASQRPSVASAAAPEAVQLPVPAPSRRTTAQASPATPAAPQAAPPPLPDELLRQWPPLVVGGAMHSDNARQRMVVINGRVLHEGDEVVPGLTLEEIRLKSAVLRHAGQRYLLAY